MIIASQIFLLIIAGVAMAIQWTLQFHFPTSKFSKLNPNFWNPELSWQNKWKNGDKMQGEKFIGSSTVFVFLTDAFHLFQFVFLNLLFAAMSLNAIITNHWYYDFIILRCAIGIPFQIFYTLFQKKNETKL